MIKDKRISFRWNRNTLREIKAISNVRKETMTDAVVHLIDKEFLSKPAYVDEYNRLYNEDLS